MSHAINERGCTLCEGDLCLITVGQRSIDAIEPNGFRSTADLYAAIVMTFDVIAIIML